MIVLNHKEKGIITARIAYILSITDNETDWKAMLNRTYCEYMADKSEEQGNIIAEHIIDELGKYETANEISNNDPDIFARYQLDQLVADKDLTQQCVVLDSFIKGLEFFDEVFVWQYSNRSDYRDFLKSKKDDKRLQPYSGPITEEAREELYEQAVQAVAQAQLTDGMLEKLEKAMSVEDAEAHQVLIAKCNDHAFRAMCAMIIYCMAKNGELTCVSEDVTMKQIVLDVCTAESMRGLVHLAEQGHLDAEQYRRQMTIRWKIRKVLMVTALVLLGTAATAAAFSNGHIVQAILAAVSTFYGVYICLGPMERTMAEMINEDAIAMMLADLLVETNADEIIEKYSDEQASSRQIHKVREASLEQNTVSANRQVKRRSLLLQNS